MHLFGYQWLPLGFQPLQLPHSPWLLLGLAFLFAATIGLIEFGVLSYAFEKMGVNRRYVYLLLFLSLLGCFVNIPVARLVPSRVEIYVNVGGAVIPIMLSLYLLIENSLYVRAAMGVAVVTAVVYFLARPVPGVGIQIQMIFVPPLIAATVALALSRDHASSLAYISGTLGTLIGADLLNLFQLASLKSPIVSIGGAGSFDGIFLTGIIAVLLA
jgi:uncharacterized membrane protein